MALTRRDVLKGMIAAGTVVLLPAPPVPAPPLGFRYVDERLQMEYLITREDIEDGLYGEISEKYAKALAKSMTETKEIVTYNTLTRTFS